MKIFIKGEWVYMNELLIKLEELTKMIKEAEENKNKIEETKSSISALNKEMADRQKMDKKREILKKSKFPVSSYAVNKTIPLSVPCTARFPDQESMRRSQVRRTDQLLFRGLCHRLLPRVRSFLH